jgi:Tol biopolymer transport system component
LHLLNVATGKLMLTPVDPDVRDAYWSSDSWRVSIPDLSQPQKLAGLPPTIGAAAWSADGKSIIYLAQAKHDAPPGYEDLYLYDPEAKTTHDLSDGLKGSVRHSLPVPLVDGSVV